MPSIALRDADEILADLRRKVSDCNRMLANLSHLAAQSGSLGKEVHLPATSLFAILDFVADQLPRWRDRPDRTHEESETLPDLTVVFAPNSAARHSEGWDILQFRTELPDEQQKGRKIDLARVPCDTTICIEGRSYTDFDTLLPIECKRLPTPKDKDRDEREYVIHRSGSTGGIQRFKEGNHGAVHRVGGMIGYVQQDTVPIWSTRIGSWISESAAAGEAGWSADDQLQPDRDDTSNRITTFRSSHERMNDLPRIELRHIWISMS